MLNEFVRNYKGLLDKFTRNGFITNYIDVDCTLNREKPISIYFTTKFGEELQKKTNLSEDEIVDSLTQIIPFNKVVFETDDKHKQMAFEHGFKAD